MFEHIFPPALTTQRKRRKSYFCDSQTLNFQFLQNMPLYLIQRFRIRYRAIVLKMPQNTSYLCIRYWAILYLNQMNDVRIVKRLTQPKCIGKKSRWMMMVFVSAEWINEYIAYWWDPLDSLTRFIRQSCEVLNTQTLLLKS